MFMDSYRFVLSFIDLCLFVLMSTGCHYFSYIFKLFHQLSWIVIQFHRYSYIIAFSLFSLMFIELLVFPLISCVLQYPYGYTALPAPITRKALDTLNLDRIPSPPTGYTHFTTPDTLRSSPDTLIFSPYTLTSSRIPTKRLSLPSTSEKRVYGERECVQTACTHSFAGYPHFQGLISIVFISFFCYPSYSLFDYPLIL